VTVTDKNVRVECEECFEWLMSDSGELPAFTPSDVGSVDEFTAPVFEGARWPQECSSSLEATGRTPTRRRADTAPRPQQCSHRSDHQRPGRCR
jgi:hypothetical protein